LPQRGSRYLLPGGGSFQRLFFFLALGFQLPPSFLSTVIVCVPVGITPIRFKLETKELMNFQRLPLLLAALFAVWWPVAGSARPLGPLVKNQGFQVIDITAQTGGNFGAAYDINNAGQVVGAANSVPFSPYDAFVYDQKQGLRFLPSVPGGQFAQATGINRAGQVVGSVILNQFSHLLLWSEQGGVVDLHPGPEWLASEPAFINDRGQVGGTVFNMNGHVGFVWDPVSGYHFVSNVTTVAGMNRHGLFIGDQLGGAVYGRDLDGVLTPILTPGHSGSARAVSQGRLILGNYYLPIGYQQAFTYRPGHKVVPLPKLPGANECFALGLNELQQVVGESDFRAVLWDRRRVYALNDALPAGSALRVLHRAFAINNKGFIVGHGNTTNTVAAFLLVPNGD
jgi:hypothetical protein